MNMRMLTRYAGMALALLLCVACGSTHEQLLKSRVLRVGVSPDYPPIIYKTGPEMRGVEAELAAYVGAKLPATVQFVEMPFADLIPRLKKGEIDVIMSGMSESDLRKVDVRFVAPYMTIGQMAMVRAEDAARYATPTNLYAQKCRIGCLPGTTGELFLKENVPQAERIACKDPDEAVVALKERKIDVFVDDAPFVLVAVKDRQLAAVPWLLTDEHLAWAVSKDKAYDHLYDRLNTIALRAKQRGDIRRIVNQYFEINVRVK